MSDKRKIVQFPGKQHDQGPENLDRDEDIFDDARSDETVGYGIPYEDDDPDITDSDAADGNEDDEELDLKTATFLQVFAALPNGLMKKVIQQFAIAAASLLVGIVVMITTHTPQALVGIIIAAWLVWKGASIVFDYQQGKIIESVVVCVSCQKHFARNEVRVMFRTPNEEVPTYFEYHVPGKKAAMFSPNMTYITYVRESTPGVLLGYQQI